MPRLEKLKAQLNAESTANLLLSSINTQIGLCERTIESLKAKANDHPKSQRLKDEISEEEASLKKTKLKKTEFEADLKKIEDNFQTFEQKLGLLASCGTRAEALIKALENNVSAERIDFYTEVATASFGMLANLTVQEHEIKDYRKQADQADGVPLCCNYPFFGKLLRKGLCAEMMKIADNVEHSMQNYLRQPLIPM